MAEFKGVFPAIVTPMTSDGGLNEAAYREVMEFNIRGGVHGLWIAGGTGESVLLTDDENMRLAEISADQGQGRVTNIMHVGAASTARAAKLAEHAARAGVDAVCAVPPFYYQTTDEAIAEHYRVIAAAADLPLFVYNIPQSTGVEITPELMQRIQDHVPQLTGVKHSSLNFDYTRSFAGMGLSVLVGQGRLMVAALTIGASGCVDGPPCVAPEPWVDIWNAYADGDLELARAAQDRAVEISRIVGRYAYHSSLKAVLSERLGIDCGSARPPLPQLTPEQRAFVLDGAARLGLTSVAVGQADD